MNRAAWLGDREPPKNVLRALQEVDPNADIRWVPGTAARPPLWEVGVWWEPNSVIRAAAELALRRHLELPYRFRKPGRILALRAIINGWRPVFGISGRDPDMRDVEEFKRRDYEYRHGLEKALIFIERQFDNDDEREEEIGRLARALADDETLYAVLARGRRSIVLTGGRKDESLRPAGSGAGSVRGGGGEAEASS